MPVELNHTIVLCRDAKVSTDFVTSILGLEPPIPFGPFLVVRLANGVSLDYYQVDGDFLGGHFAFLIGDDDFDRIFARIEQRGLTYWADPGRTLPNQINHHDGGRGVYFADPDNHLLEVITVPYRTEMGRHPA